MKNAFRRLGRFFAGLTIVVLLLAGGAGFILWQAWQPAATEGDVVVSVPRGVGVGTIGDVLAAEGIVPSRWHLMAWSRLLRDERSLKAGEYRFPAGITGVETLDILRSGRSIQYTISIPEGLTSFQVVELLRNDDRLTGEIDDIPPEGSLLPETYSFIRGDSRQAILDRMSASMNVALDHLWVDRQDDLPFETPAEAVILASIIEKETGVAEERDVVASVFVNRLRNGMPLQSDPTVVYALTEGEGPLGRPLYRSDWAVDHPYNTYEIEGMPPGPIANPGMDSLTAALNPAQTDYVYFVADGSGGHAFARTLDEHNRNVAAWRLIRDSGQAPQ